MTSPSTSTAKIIEHAYAHRLEAARLAKQSGQKVVGFVSTAVPSEVIAAAGILPVMITGDCRANTALADEWMEDMFDPTARAIFQAALAGELEFLDALIIPRSADSFLRLYLYLREVERLGITKRLPRVVLYDLLQTPGTSSARHNLAQLQKLRAVLAEIAGHGIGDAELSAAVESANRNRVLLRQLLDRRRNADISGALVLTAIATRYFIALEQHSALLEALLRELASAAATHKPRVIVTGNAQDNTALHRLLDAHGLHVVGDYHWLGDSCCERDIDLQAAADTWSAVSTHYHLHSLSSRRFPNSPEEILEYAKRCRAQGAVFYLFEQEEALTWDTPNQVKALADAGIRSLVLENQPYFIEPSSEATKMFNAFATELAGAP